MLLTSILILGLEEQEKKKPIKKRTNPATMVFLFFNVQLKGIIYSMLSDENQISLIAFQAPTQPTPGNLGS